MIVGYVPGKRGVDLGTEAFLQRKATRKLPYNYRIPLLHIGVIPPLCGIVSCHIQGGLFMSKNSFYSIFTPEYWITASSEFRNLRSLVFAGLTIALSTVLSSLYIPVGVNLRVTTAFLALALGSMVFGPVVGLSVGLAYDFIGYLCIPSIVFFPGYTLSSMLEFFIYGLFLYRCRISVLRISLCKLLINFGIHVGLGCLWSSMLYEKGYYYFFVKSLIKNAIMLPIEIIMLVALLQIFLPILVHLGILSKQKNKYIPLV